MPSKQRIFIALPVSDEAKSELKLVKDALMELNKRKHVKWADPDLAHVTLLFLGELDAREVEKVKTILQQTVSEHSGWKFWLDALDAFPNKSNPNILTVMVKEKKREGLAFQQNLACRLVEAGLSCDVKPWKPHVTIGRNKRHEHIEGVHSVSVKKAIWEVDAVHLMESELKSEGPKYITLGKYSLL